jgi:general secretion pathway protein G
MKTKTRGYTLIELLAVLAVIAVLALMVQPLAEMSHRREQERELRRALWEIRDAIDAYKRASDTGLVPHEAGQPAYPPTLQALVRGVTNGQEGAQTLYFLRRLPRDPFADPGLPAEQTWGLRSYESPPDQPAPGRNVYDVYSRSPLVGLDGVPLRAW